MGTSGTYTYGAVPGTPAPVVPIGAPTDQFAGTYAAARLLQGVNSGDRLQVLGRTAQSDDGQGLFTWAPGASVGVDDGYELQAPTGVWRRTKKVIRAEWYGLDSTGIVPCDVAMNLAVKHALLQKKKLILPGGIFLFNNPWFLFILGLNQANLHIEGQGTGLAGGPGFPVGPLGADYHASTILLFNTKTLPGLVYQNARNGTLKNLAIMGLNSTAFNGPAIPSNNQSDYVGAGFATGAQSPSCAIAIDPFTAALPADGGYVGLASYYGPTPSGSGSSGLRFEEVFISQFVVGIAAGCSSVSQGDEMSFVNCDVKYCDTGFACGNTQARNNTFAGGQIANCRTAFDTLNYGASPGNGCNPIAIERMQFVHLYQILGLNNTTPVTMKGCYAESISSVGLYGKSPSNANPLVLEGNQFGITDSLFSGKIPPLVLECLSPLAAKGNRIQSDTPSRDVFNIICASGAGGSLEQCSFTGSPYTDLPPHIGIDLNGIYGSHILDCMCTSGLGSYAISDTWTQRFGIASIANGKGRYRGTWQSRWITDGNLRLLYQSRASVPHINVNCVAASLAIVGTTLTFQESTLGELQVNDILLWTMLPQGFSANTYTVPMWKVASIDGSGNVVANALYDITLYDTVANTASHTGANLVVVVLHQWAPTTALTGNTHSNTVLDGLSSSALINGDWVQGVGIPIKTRVVSGGGTASVVLSKAATSTLNGINVYDGQLVVAQEQTGAFFPSQIGNTGAAPVPTFANGARQAWTLSASATWGAPTGAWKVGDRLVLLITATGAFTTAWNAVFRGAPAWAVAANGQTAVAEFMKIDGTNWQYMSGSTGFA